MPTRRRYGPTRTTRAQRYPSAAMREVTERRRLIPRGMPIDHLVPPTLGTLGFPTSSLDALPAVQWRITHGTALAANPRRIPCAPYDQLWAASSGVLIDA
jgi:hypothetical protein